MEYSRTWRPANGRTPNGGLQDPDRSDGGALILDRNPRDDGRNRALWLIVALTFDLWGVGAVLLFYAVGRSSLEGIGLSAFALGTSLLLLFAAVREVFAREQLEIDATGLEYRWSNGLARDSRLLPFPELRSITPYVVTVRRVNNQWPYQPCDEYVYGLAIETLGRTLYVGQSREADAVDRLQEILDRLLRVWYPVWGTPPQCNDGGAVQGLGKLPVPPSDSRLSCRREWDRTEFLCQDPVDRSVCLCVFPAALAAMSLPCIALGRIATSADSLLFPGLLVVASAGLCTMIPWIWAMLGRRRWAVRPGEITITIPGLGLLWSRTTEIEWLDRIDLCRIASPDDVYRYREPRFRLALVDLDGDDRATFGPLTEGEARWMAGIVADVLKDALPRDGQEIYRWSVSAEAPAAGSRAMADAWLDEGLAGPGARGSERGK